MPSSGDWGPVLLVVSLLALAWMASRSPPPRLADPHPASPVWARVAFLGPPWLGEYLLVSQAPKTVVGVSRPVLTGYARSLQAQTTPDLQRLPAATLGQGYAPNLEALLRLKLTSVLVPTSAQIVPGVGLRFQVFPRGKLDLNLAPQTHLFAAMAGRPGRVAPLVALNGRQEVAAVAQPGSGVRPRVAVLWVAANGEIGLFGPNQPVATMITRGGGRNAVQGRGRGPNLIDVERLLALDPDVIVLAQLLQRDTPTPQHFIADPRFSVLRAARARRVYAAPTSWTWYGSIVETPAYQRWMTDRIAGLPSCAATQLLQSAYLDAEGERLTAAQTAQALSEPANRDMAGGVCRPSPSTRLP